MTKTISQKLEVFQNRCLRRILRIFWPNTISNYELRRITRTETITQQVQLRRWRWRWIGHVLRVMPTDLPRVALRWTTDGRRKRGRPKEIWRRTVEREMRDNEWTWGHLERAAADRSQWRYLVEALCAPRHEEEMLYSQMVTNAGCLKPLLDPAPQVRRTAPRRQLSRPISVGLPYVSGLSEHLSRVIRAQHIRTYHKPYNTLRSILVHPKDRTSTEKKTGVVYDITCNDCGEHYIGETARILWRRDWANTRNKQHLQSGNTSLRPITRSTGKESRFLIKIP
ncbi:hypothetical protein ACROYT_G040098 [Oculina patagonica]